MTHRSFAETVLSADSLSIDSFIYEPTLFDQLVALFRFPLGRDYPGKYWGGARLKRDRYVHRMARYVEGDGNHFFSSDDREYVQPTSTNWRDVSVGEKTVKVDVPKPWRRLTPKYIAGGYRAVRSGFERRMRLRAERSVA